jgi:hypothetical protein
MSIKLHLSILCDCLKNIRKKNLEKQRSRGGKKKRERDGANKDI